MSRYISVISLIGLLFISVSCGGNSPRVERGKVTETPSPTVTAEYRLWEHPGNYLTEFKTLPDGLALFQWRTFENEAFGGKVAIMKNDGEPFIAEGLRTAALNGDWSKIAIGRVIPVDVSPEPRGELVDETERIAREIGVPVEEVKAARYSDGFRAVGRVSQPFIVDLETGAETPLPVAGGDFLYWLNDDELVIGHETSGRQCIWQGSLEAIKYNVDTGEREPFAIEELTQLLNERCTEGITEVDSVYRPASYADPGDLSPLYTSKDWRILPAACVSELGKPAPPVVVPSRGGQFENSEEVVYWVPAAGGPRIRVGGGNALAASDDGVWLFVRSKREFTPRYYTVDGVRVRDDIVRFEGFYVYRLAWE
jgi:hypothetical protein